VAADLQFELKGSFGKQDENIELRISRYVFRMQRGKAKGSSGRCLCEIKTRGGGGSWVARPGAERSGGTCRAKFTQRPPLSLALRLLNGAGSAAVAPAVSWCRLHATHDALRHALAFSIARSALTRRASRRLFLLSMNIWFTRKS